MRFLGFSCIVLLGWVSTSSAGLYYSGETFADLPSQWQGYMLDHRHLRNIAVLATPNNPITPMREKYLAEADKLAKKGALNADETADLGALHLRLGQVDKAIALLVPAQRRHIEHFRINANLGTAWQMRGDLAQAAACLEQSVRLAPKANHAAESLHLKLVRHRLNQGKKIQPIDDLFGVHYVGEKGLFEPGKWAEAQKKKLPPDSVAHLQQLALWLPDDANLLWQLAELANAYGDIRHAAAMMEGCITALGLSDTQLRERRELVRAAVEALPHVDIKIKRTPVYGTLPFRSNKPLVKKLDPALLPVIRDKASNTLHWEVLEQTVLNNKALPIFHPYLQKLVDKEVTITGFMQPISDGFEVNEFMFFEHPIGCWFCEMPEFIGIIQVELPEGKSIVPQRQLMRVTGRLSLNSNDPEGFLYIIRNARAAGFD